MKKFISLQFEDYVIDEVNTLYDTLDSCLEEIEDSENSSDDEVKLFSRLEDMLDLDDIKDKLRDALDSLLELRDLL